MANTEGIPDEDLYKLLSMNSNPPNVQGKETASRRAMSIRQRMMEDFNSGEQRPAATVIRSSSRTKVPTVSSTRNKNSSEQKYDNGDSLKVSFAEDQSDAGTRKGESKGQPVGVSGEPAVSLPSPFLSDSIREKPITHLNMQSDHAKHKRVSKFKMRQQKLKSEATGPGSGVGMEHSMPQGGFPSFDLPVGSLTRRGRTMNQTQNSLEPPKIESTDRKKPSEVDTMLANMSQKEIKDSVAELESILSPSALKFLRNRSKKASGTNRKNDSLDRDGQREQIPIMEENVPGNTLSIQGESKQVVTLEEKEEMAKTLAFIQTEEELDQAFAATMGITETVVNEDENETELESASKLLRSTAFRQRVLGAKRVCELLESRVHSMLLQKEYTMSQEDVSSYPILLPVALRCILDQPCTEKYRLLHSLALRSIYALVILFCHPEHRVFLFKKREVMEPTHIYQMYFMKDAVPIPSPEVCYPKEETDQKQDDQNNDSTYYATDSSAESASLDGKAFYKDPLWTLLSRMRILPCLAKLLKPSYAKNLERGDEKYLSLESLVSICGILSVMSQRSPGGACAIAQHQNILPSLMSMALEPCDSLNLSSNDKLDNMSHISDSEKKEYGSQNEGLVNNFLVNTAEALPVVILLCTLSRQSRTVAQSPHVEASMHYVICILSAQAESTEECLLQRFCIILWRIRLRYALSLQHLSTFLSLSANQLTVCNQEQFSLAPEYLSAFGALCDCVRITTFHGGFKGESDKSILSNADRETLIMAGVWLSSHAKGSYDFLMKTLESGDRGDLKLVSARVVMMFSYVAATSPTDFIANVDEESKDSNGLQFDSTDSKLVPVIPRSYTIDVLRALVDGGMLSDCLHIVLRNPFSSFSRKEPNISLADEACACGLVDSFYSSLFYLMGPLLRNGGHGVHDEDRSKLDLLLEKVFARTIAILERQWPSSIFSIDLGERDSHARSGWLNHSHFSIARFLVLVLSIRPGSNAVGKVFSVVQCFNFCLIGRFQRSEEAMATILLSQDVLFRADATPILSDPTAHPTQDMLLQEFCRTKISRAQLDHSFKLIGRPGISSQGKGPFTLESLRNETDLRDYSTPNAIELHSPLLPLESDWMWKVLSSSLITEDEQKLEELSSAIEDASLVVKSCLSLLLSIELASSEVKFSSTLPLGTKMYHLLNICLLPEHVLRHDGVIELFDDLFNLYWQPSTMEKTINEKREFVLACYKHSHNEASKSKLSIAEEDEAYDEKVLEIFYGSHEKDGENSSRKELKAVDDFIGDLCKAFTDFGAQYDIFVHTTRYLLTPYFPIRFRMKVLANLSDLLHLLTTQKEMSNLEGSEILSAVEKSLTGGLPNKDGSKRDPPEFLDELSSLISRRDVTTGDLKFSATGTGFFYIFAVAHLARNLASSSLNCDCGLEKMKYRLKSNNVCSLVLVDIVSAAFLLMKSDGTGRNLAVAVQDVCIKKKGLFNAFSDWKTGEKYNDEVWDSMIKSLKESFER